MHDRPDEEERLERRKEEAKKPLIEKYPHLWMWVLAATVCTVIVFVATYWAAEKMGLR